MAKFNVNLMLSTIGLISMMARGVALGDIEVFVNDSVSMRCSPNGSTDIQWHHNSYINYVYAGGQLRYPYDRRFLVKKYETTGEYDLIIPNVTIKDAGLYYCSDELSGRRINSTQLIVLYMKPVCSSNMPTDGFIGPNTCNVQQENMVFTCDVTFNGSAPHLSWISANDSQVFNSSTCEVMSNRISCSLTLRADPFYDGSVLRCDVGQMKLDDQRYSCNTKRIKVHYFYGDYAHEKKYVHETASCLVRSNLNVRFNWTLKQDNEGKFLTLKQTVSIEKPGLHQCEVKYSIRNVTCSLMVSVVNATMFIARTDAPKEQSNTLLAVILTIALVSVIALIGLIVFILKLRRRRRLRRGKDNSPVRVDEPLIEKEISAINNNRQTLHFRTSLNFKRETQSENRSSDSDIDLLRVVEVTKLKMKVYVLCLIKRKGLIADASFSTMICVFEDRSPYPIVEEISLRFDALKFYVSEFMSIVSSVKDYLYLLAYRIEETHCLYEVIRVEIKENNDEYPQKPPSKWLELEVGYRPSTLSISRDADLMMVNRSSPIILRIYDPDARLSLSVELHEDILEARKAVETSNGNFIVLHSMKRQTEDADDGDRAKGKNEDNSIEEGENVVEAVSEVSRDGNTIICRFIPQNQEQQLTTRLFTYGGDLCTDSEGRVFVADTGNHRVIVLDSYLRWIESLILPVKNGDENEKLRWPSKLFYGEDSNEMIVLGKDFNATEERKVSIYDLIFK